MSFVTSLPFLSSLMTRAYAVLLVFFLFVCGLSSQELMKISFQDSQEERIYIVTVGDDSSAHLTFRMKGDEPGENRCFAGLWASVVESLKRATAMVGKLKSLETRHSGGTARWFIAIGGPSLADKSLDRSGHPLDQMFVDQEDLKWKEVLKAIDVVLRNHGLEVPWDA